MIPLHDDNPTERFPVVSVALILACSTLFLYQVSLGDKAGHALVIALGSIPAVLFGKQMLPPELALIPVEATLISSMFLHGGWMHLIGNMLYLWIFGNNVEDAMSRPRFIVFYTLCGLIAALSHALPNANSAIPMIGASGAISGVLGGYLLLHPKARVLVLIPLGFASQLIRLPAMLVLAFWFVLQVVNSILADSTGGGVAWGAHVGGFVAGLVLLPLFKRRSVRLFN
ncbi:MAG: rhomboid family intramembrane serine protease [Gammaproteobacteria bacterium]|nr:rhomboid family intramembrane serine protease [Gammaproteobacteria bacterium]